MPQAKPLPHAEPPALLSQIVSHFALMQIEPASQSSYDGNAEPAIHAAPSAAVPAGTQSTWPTLAVSCTQVQRESEPVQPVCPIGSQIGPPLPLPASIVVVLLPPPHAANRASARAPRARASFCIRFLSFLRFCCGKNLRDPTFVATGGQANLSAVDDMRSTSC